MKHKNTALAGYPGPDPRSVALCLPIADFRPDWEFVTGILQCMPFFARPIVYAGCSMVNQARNVIAHQFLHKYEKFEWAVWIDSDIGFFPQDWVYLMEGNDPFVSAPYSKKNIDHVKVTTGFGFVKVHRRVFEAIANLLDDEGKERVPRFFFQGEMMVDYFPCGASGNGSWMGEDDGFIAWASLAGFPPRIEERCNLTHFGRYGYKLPKGAH